jgi:hypothetical protein
VKEVHEHVVHEHVQDDDDEDHVNEEHDLVVLHSSHVDDDVTMAEHERKQMAVHVDDAIDVMHEKNVDHDTKQKAVSVPCDDFHVDSGDSCWIFHFQ